jgi:hypothetical protein
VISLLVLALVAFLVELDLQELKFLVVDRLVLFELGLEIVVLLLDFLKQQLKLSYFFSLLNALGLLLLVVSGYFSFEFSFELLVLLLELGC